MSSAPIAVAVVSWNTRDLLDRCLRSFGPVAERGLADVWVVDNASSDGSAEMVHERFGWVNLVASAENLGFGAAVNLVAERTSNPWIAPANADIAVRPGALEMLLEAGARDPGAGAVAPRLVLPDGTTQHSAFAFPTIPYVLALTVGAYHLSSTLGDRYAVPGFWNPDRRRRVPWAIAAFLIVRRTAWDDAGGFDARQWMYAEDLELGWRLRDAGWATRYEPLAAVDHEESAAVTQHFGPELAPHWQRATYECITRQRGRGHLYAVAGLNLAGTLARAALAASRGDRDRVRGLVDWAKVHLEALGGQPPGGRSR